MEVNKRRSRGFVIAKLMPFCKAAKPPTPSQELYNNVHYTSSTTTSYNSYVTATTPLPPKLSFLLQPSVALAPEDKDVDKKLNKAAEKLIGRGMNGVDARAASYISSVRERFKLETINVRENDDCC